MERNKQIIKVSIVGIITNVLLATVKFIIGILANSIVIVLDAVNNLSDVISSLVTMIGIKISTKKPDKLHPYGYGRVEYFSSIVIAILILTAGFSSIKESTLKVINPVEATYSYITIIIIIIAIITKILLGLYVKKQGKELNSGSLIASGTDALSDALISLSTLVAAIISIIWHISIEGYLGVLISIYIIRSAFNILKETLGEIIGARADGEITTKLKKKIGTYDKVEGVYDLIVHNYGPNYLIATAHIEVPDNLTAKEIHELTRKITFDVYAKFGIIITIGIYASNDQKKYSDIKKDIEAICKEYPSILQTHGFYVDEGIRLISFDAMFSFEEHNPEKVTKEIIKKLKKDHPPYNFSIIIDKDFSD